MMQMVGDSEDKLARELIHYEMEVENKVVVALKNIGDVSIRGTCSVVLHKCVQWRCT
jgi:hypothetical protein